MSAQDDPRYMQLYRDYARAIQEYQNAIDRRRRVRQQAATAAAEEGRSPPRAGGGAAAASPSQAGPAGGSTSVPSVMKVYMGPILGWVRFVGSSSAIAGGPEPDAAFDPGAVHDAISLQLYWNVKTHYESCRRAFFDHVRRQNIQHHRQQAVAALQHAANLQLLGVESENPLAEAQREIEGSCRNAWALYQGAPTPKTRAMVVMLTENLADSQFVGLESPTTRLMSDEVNRLIDSGELKRE
jgi:hypothetical protein